MKITIQPTDDQRSRVSPKYSTVTIEHPDDDLNIEEVREIVNSALIAWGFHPDIVTNEFQQP